MATIVAIEGGGTKTRGWLATGGPADPKVLAERIGGSSNYHSIGATALGAVLKDVLAPLLSSHPVEAVALGMAGIETPADRQVLKSALAEAGCNLPSVIVNDAQAALHGATRGQGGILVISGTGSIALGSDGRGNEARAGGWGYHVGDEGSGYALGRALLRHATWVLDRRSKRTQIFEALLRHLKLKEPAELVTWIREHCGRPSEVARLSPLVTAAAAAGDETGARMVERAAFDLARMVRAVRRQLHLKRNLNIVLYGGLLVNDAHFCRVTEDLMATYLREARILVGHPDDGLKGCVLLGLKKLEEERPR